MTMRKLWVKAWMTLDGVFDAETMDHWWQNTNSPARMQHITEEYANGDAYLLGRVTYEMLWPGWSQQTTGDGPGPLLNRNAQICRLDHAQGSALERIDHHRQECGRGDRRPEAAAGQGHHHRWQCDPGPLAAGHGSDRRVPVP